MLCTNYNSDIDTLIVQLADIDSSCLHSPIDIPWSQLLLLLLVVDI